MVQILAFFLMGHSWGGTTGTHVLLNTPLQSELKGWIEVDGAHDFKLNDKEAAKMFLAIGNEEIAANRNLDFWKEIVAKVSVMDTNNITSENSLYLNSKGV